MLREIGDSEMEVIVAVEQCYSDNDGAFDVVYSWDGLEVSSDILRGDYGITPHVDATLLQISEAGDWMQRNSGDVGVRNGIATHIGCIVTLQRSRKAPNNVELEVIDHADRRWNSSYMRYDDDKVCVSVDGSAVWVSVGCIKEIVKYRRPWWAKR